VAIIFASTGTATSFVGSGSVGDGACNSSAPWTGGKLLWNYAGPPRKSAEDSDTGGEGAGPCFRLDLHDIAVTTAPSDNVSRGCVMREGRARDEWVWGR